MGAESLIVHSTIRRLFFVLRVCASTFRVLLTLSVSPLQLVLRDFTPCHVVNYLQRFLFTAHAIVRAAQLSCMCKRFPLVCLYLNE